MRLSLHALRAAAVAILFVLTAAAHANGLLVEHFERAKYHDPLFQAARAERESNLVSSQIARSALYPSLSSFASWPEREGSAQNITLSQPLIDASRYATFMEGKPRAKLAETTFVTREHELVTKFMKSAFDLVRARESLAFNQAKIDTFAQQARSAKRSNELGTGTITDVRDAQVRLDQARAADISLRARLAAAERQYAAITGILPDERIFILARREPVLTTVPLTRYLDQASQGNPQLTAAKLNQEIAQLDVSKAKGALLPTLNIALTRTRTRTSEGTLDDNYAGLQLNFPVQVGSYLQVSAATANAQRFSEQTREVEQRTRLEVERLLQLVEAGRTEVAIRLESIRSAELSVEANEKSFRGGIRSKLDVLNSIQILYQTKEEHLNSVLVLAENFLNLQIVSAAPLNATLQQIEHMLFQPSALKTKLEMAPRVEGISAANLSTGLRR